MEEGCEGAKERGRERGRNGGRERGKEGGMEVGMEAGREGGSKEGRRDGGREGGREIEWTTCTSVVLPALFPVYFFFSFSDVTYACVCVHRSCNVIQVICDMGHESCMRSKRYYIHICLYSYIYLCI